MRVQIRLGRTPAPTRFQMGVSSVPLLVMYTEPSLWPTQIMSEFPTATAMALMKLPAPADALIASQVVKRDSELRQRLSHPAKILFGRFGARMNGAMKLAFAGSLESPIPSSIEIATFPPSTLRKI